MAKTKSKGMNCEGNCESACCMHPCCKCAAPILIFGLLFIIAGFGLWTDAPLWFNGWTIFGVMLAMIALVKMFMKK